MSAIKLAQNACISLLFFFYIDYDWNGTQDINDGKKYHKGTNYFKQVKI